jgi:hypothetical protein
MFVLFQVCSINFTMFFIINFGALKCSRKNTNLNMKVQKLKLSTL